MQLVRQVLRGSPIQAKLKVGAPNDAYEQEADRVADRVMRMPVHNYESRPALLKSQLNVRRMCAACEDEAAPGQMIPTRVQRQPVAEEEEEVQAKRRDFGAEWVQRQAVEEEEEEIQAKRRAGSAGSSSATLADGLGALRGRGTPLSGDLRGFFEPRFGTNFGQVRVHTDAQSATLADSLHARAFTVGSDIVFAKGEYSPGNTESRRLMAHELTHVLQQTRHGTSSGAAQRLQRKGANPDCTAAEVTDIHQAIDNAAGWVNKALPQLTIPVSDKVKRSLRANFGATQGVEANAPMIKQRLEAGRNEMQTMPYRCRDAADATCAAGHCGYATGGAGNHQATICSNATLSGQHWIFQAGCVLHEAFHARFSNMVDDSYSGWFGHSSSTAGYPGASPLLNADSYTKLAMDLS